MERERLERFGADDGDDRLRDRLVCGRRRDRVEELLALLSDHGEGCSDRSQLSFPGNDAQDDAPHRGSDLDRRLLGLDLDDRLMLVDRLPLCDEPARDLPLAEALAKIGQRERVRHDWAA